MDFSITEEQSAIKDVIARFIENEYDFEKRMKIAESDSAYDKEVYNFFVEQGFTAIPFSEEDGGLNGGPVETMLIMKEIGRGLVLEPFLENIILAGGILKRLANQHQKDEWLNKIINGEMQSTLAFTEPQSRFQLNDVATTANKPSPSTPKPVKPKAEILDLGEGKSYLAIPQEFTRAWRDTELVLQRAGYIVQEKSQEKGMYKFLYFKPKGEEKKSLLKKLKFWGDDDDEGMPYQLNLTGVGAKTEIIIMDEDGEWETGEDAGIILAKLKELYNQL